MHHIAFPYETGRHITVFNPFNAELNPICHLLALLGAHHILHVSRERVKIVSTSRLLSVFFRKVSLHLILLDFITRTTLGEEYRSLSSSLCSLLHSPVTLSLLGPNILLNTIFSNTLSFLSSLNVNDQVSHPHKTTGKIIVLYILIFKFLDSNLEDKRFCTEW